MFKWFYDENKKHYIPVGVANGFIHVKCNYNMYRGFNYIFQFDCKHRFVRSNPRKWSVPFGYHIDVDLHKMQLYI